MTAGDERPQGESESPGGTSHGLPKVRYLLQLAAEISGVLALITAVVGFATSRGFFVFLNDLGLLMILTMVGIAIARGIMLVVAWVFEYATDRKVTPEAVVIATIVIGILFAVLLWWPGIHNPYYEKFHKTHKVFMIYGAMGVIAPFVLLLYHFGSRPNSSESTGDSS
ncbi:hypothetical protein [Rhodococcus indonesiensis]|uniref:hypothetical protein n=1 Tax=Rhodococcus indonesiensis TaxID=3055869 RepID=UPI0039F6F7B4